MVSQWSLISGEDIILTNGTRVAQPTLQKIRDGGGYLEYLSALNLILISRDTLLEKIGVGAESLELDVANNLSTYIVYVVEPTRRELLGKALTFFIPGNMSFNNGNYSYVFYDNNDKLIGFVDNECFSELQSIVADICNCSLSEKSTINFTSEKARQTYERTMKGRKAIQAAKKTDVSMGLPNIVSAVISKHGGYTYDNIWSLTVCQLYDLFYRISTQTQLDVYGTRWAAYGQDPFDFSIWYKSPLN